MLETLTKGAIQVIMLAQEEARRAGHNRCGTEQILLGLIGQEKGIAAQVLQSKGLTLKETRSNVKELIGQGNDFQRRSWLVRLMSAFKEMPFSERTKKVLELSWDESRKQGVNHVDTEHLLLALLRLNEGHGIEVLKKHGFDFDELRQLLVRKAA